MFQHIKGFSKEEKWGDPYQMDGIIVILLEKVRELYKKQYDENASFVIHEGYAKDGHTTNSYHYKGMAIDFHIKTRLSFVKQVRAVLKILTDLQFNYKVGLGIYPDWNNPGFHLDNRGKIARWGFIKDEMVSFENTLKHAETKED